MATAHGVSAGTSAWLLLAIWMGEIALRRPLGNSEGRPRLKLKAMTALYPDD